LLVSWCWSSRTLVAWKCQRRRQHNTRLARRILIVFQLHQRPVGQLHTSSKLLLDARAVCWVEQGNNQHSPFLRRPPTRLMVVRVRCECSISYLPYLLHVLWLKYTSKSRFLVTAHKVHVVRDYECVEMVGKSSLVEFVKSSAKLSLLLTYISGEATNITKTRGNELVA
jgi:hypothetical protein